MSFLVVGRRKNSDLGYWGFFFSNLDFVLEADPELLHLSPSSGRAYDLERVVGDKNQGIEQRDHVLSLCI